MPDDTGTGCRTREDGRTEPLLLQAVTGMERNTKKTETQYIMTKSILFVLTILIAAPCIKAQDPQEGEQQEAPVTKVNIGLNFPDTVPLVVQMAIYENNPFQIYDNVVNKNKAFISKRLSQMPNQEAAVGEATSMMTYYWDYIFNDVSGFDVINISNQADGNILYTSPDMEGKFWVTTKVTYFGQFFVCWCLPIEVEAGMAYTVELNSDNTLDLKGLFNYVLTQKDQRQPPPDVIDSTGN